VTRRRAVLGTLAVTALLLLLGRWGSQQYTDALWYDSLGARDVWRARFADLGPGGGIRKGSSGDCSIAGAHGDLTHDGIDHVVISESLKRRLTSNALTMHVVNYQDAHGLPVHGRADLALPSDHCPHVVTWTGKRPR